MWLRLKGGRRPWMPILPNAQFGPLGLSGQLPARLGRSFRPPRVCAAGERPGCEIRPVWPKKGGVGYFLTKIPRMSLMVFGLRGGYLVCFARFCDTFCDVLRGRRGLGGCCGRGGRQRRGWLLWSPTLAWQTRNTGKGTARVGHPAFPASATVFRIFSCMVSALRRTTSIVRFWGLIACKVWRTFLGGLVFCFVGFSDGGEFRGLDNSWGAGLWCTRRLTG